MIRNKKISIIKGFTLLELIVVIAIIGILSVIVLPSFNNALARARDSRRVAEVSGISKNLMLWSQSNDNLFPANFDMSSISNCNQPSVTSTSSLCAIIKGGVSNRLPSSVFGPSKTIHYVGIGCYPDNAMNVPSKYRSLCQSFQLWTELELKNTALEGDDDVIATSSSFPNVSFASPVISNLSLIKDGTQESCTSSLEDCIYDITP